MSLERAREGTRPMKNGRTYLFQIDPTWQRCKHRKDIQFGQTLVAGVRQALLGTRARATRAQVPLSSAKLVDYGILHSIGKIMGTRTHMYAKICNYYMARTYLQLPLRQWGAGNVYLLVLSSSLYLVLLW